jgi:prevent-host-death family protein
MKRTVTATEAKNRLGALIRLVKEEGDAVVIESRREPVAVLVSPSDFAELRRLREERERAKAIERIREIAARQEQRNSDLSAEEAEALVQEAIRDVREMRRAGGARAAERVG